MYNLEMTALDNSESFAAQIIYDLVWSRRDKQTNMKLVSVPLPLC